MTAFVTQISCGGSSERTATGTLGLTKLQWVPRVIGKTLCKFLDLRVGLLAGLALLLVNGSAMALAGEAPRDQRAPLAATGGMQCFKLKRERGEPPLAKMPAVCRALVSSLNASCATKQRPFRLAVASPVAGLALPNWQSLPLAPQNTTLLESLVRARWKGLNLVLLPFQRKAGWRSRMDWEWEVVRRAIDRARERGDRVSFERTSLSLIAGAPPTIYYRMSIERPSGVEETLPPVDSIGRYVNQFGASPEIYAAADSQRAEYVSGAGQEFVIFGQTPYLIAADQAGVYRVREIAVDRSVVALDACTIRPAASAYMK